MRAGAGIVLSLLLALPATANEVVVLNSGEASISVLDLATMVETRRVPVLRETHHLVLTPDRSTLIVGDSGANELLFLDPATAEIRRRERISNPYHFAFTPDGARFVVTSLRRDQVDVYDWDGATQALTLRHRLKVGDMPSHLAFSPDSSTAFVSLQGANRLLSFDIATGTVRWDMRVGRAPAGVLWHRGQLLVGNMGEDNIAVVDPATGVVTRRIVIGRGAHTIFAAPDGRALYATARVDSGISVLNPDTLDVETTWAIPGGPDCLDFAPDGRIWATLRWQKRVAVIDPATGAYETAAVGRSPHGIFIHGGGE